MDPVIMDDLSDPGGVLDCYRVDGYERDKQVSGMDNPPQSRSREREKSFFPAIEVRKNNEKTEY